MTKQEYYQLLVQSATNGTFPSLSAEGRCAYRGAEGRKCAVGLLISDEAYRESMESLACTAIYDNFDLPKGLNLLDLRKIQMLHDLHAGPFWSAQKFIKELNTLSFFSDVEKVNPDEIVCQQ